jgi:hypothetical protein
LLPASKGRQGATQEGEKTMNYNADNPRSFALSGSWHQLKTKFMSKIRAFGLAILMLALATAFTVTIDLEKKSLLSDKVELKIPKGFEIMSEGMMKIKYPSERRPALIYTNETGGINVALNLTQNKASQDLISAYKDNFVKMFKNMYPSADWKDNGIKEINGKKIGYLELVTPAIDTEIYNLMFFTDLDGKLLLCTFNCTKKDINEWTPIAKEIMFSLKIK